MLEVLLMQYEDQFGVAFPLKNYVGYREIDLINIIYYCVQNNILCEEVNEKELQNRFPDAPHK